MCIIVYKAILNFAIKIQEGDIRMIVDVHTHLFSAKDFGPQVFFDMQKCGISPDIYGIVFMENFNRED